MECHSMTQSCSTFAIKYFWQILNMICNFAKLIVVDPYMLCNFSCHGQFHKHAIFLQVCLVCSALFCSECIKLTKRPTCYRLCHALFSAKSGNLLTKLAMFTCLPSYLLVLFGLWSVRDFCHMHLVEHCHALFCYVKFL